MAQLFLFPSFFSMQANHKRWAVITRSSNTLHTVKTQESTEFIAFFPNLCHMTVMSAQSVCWIALTGLHIRLICLCYLIFADIQMTKTCSFRAQWLMLLILDWEGGVEIPQVADVLLCNRGRRRRFSLLQPPSPPKSTWVSVASGSAHAHLQSCRVDHLSLQVTAFTFERINWFIGDAKIID